MSNYVLGLDEIDKTREREVGGKGANLGELCRMEGIQVPAGFCLTTRAYRHAISDYPELDSLLGQLSLLQVQDQEELREVSGKVRRVIEEMVVPEDIEEEVRSYVSRLGEGGAWAVRSSATAEDLPLASFAGQHDTYLNVTGPDSILQHIPRCWASLFNEEAVIYRMQDGLDHRQMEMAVVVQRMVFPRAAGVMFTADPVTCNRKVTSIEAACGAGEALVSGRVRADVYQVREGRITEKKVAEKKLELYPSAGGDTQAVEIERERQHAQVLDEEEVRQLAAMGREIEAHFGAPQDIEWCLADGVFFVVQSRPITTLYPLPEVSDEKNRVFVSLGHQQNMTDPIRPLGMSAVELIGTRFPTLSMRRAGGRYFLDVSHDLASPLGRPLVLALGKSDPLIENAIRQLMKRKEFMRSLARGRRTFGLRNTGLSWACLIDVIKIYRNPDVAVIKDLMRRNEESLGKLQQRIAEKSGEELLDFILEDARELQDIMYNSRSVGAIAVCLIAANWLDKKMKKWLGEENAADRLSKAVENNPASDMGLALLDVADVARHYPAVIAYFRNPNHETFFADLARLEGGEAVANALQEYLKKHGMRCPGEFDMTRSRWSERPVQLVPLILNNIKNFEPNARSTIIQQGRREVEQTARDLLQRVEKLPRGKIKAHKTRKMIKILRNLAGYREYPKYAFMQRLLIYKQALLQEADELVGKGVLREKEDIYYLYFSELGKVIRGERPDYDVISGRKAEYQAYDRLKPPRVMTSEGEAISGQQRDDAVLHGALPGIPASSGMAEGRARVVLRMEDADLEEGDILVTLFTDPSWSPLFVSVKGLVTEVGGTMTHGAIVAREYGIPAVAGVENATGMIKDGQRIRVNGTKGLVEML